MAILVGRGEGVNSRFGLEVALGRHLQLTFALAIDDDERCIRQHYHDFPMVKAFIVSIEYRQRFGQ